MWFFLLGVYPLYASLEALRKPRNKMLQRWLIFWIVYFLVEWTRTVLQGLLSRLFFWIPYGGVSLGLLFLDLGLSLILFVSYVEVGTGKMRTYVLLPLLREIHLWKRKYLPSYEYGKVWLRVHLFLLLGETKQK